MRKAFTLLAFLLTFHWMSAIAQERTITGKITSSQDNLGIPGVTVAIDGTTLGVTTDVDGNYSLPLPASATKLRISSVGMKTKLIDITASNTVDVVMEEDVLKLDEVVVTALGISREKKSLAYATQTISGDDASNLRTGNTVSELEGKISGLTVINSSGDAGGGAYIRLRGVTTLTGDNSPLFVVDGIPLDNSPNNYDPTFSGFQASGANGNTTGGVTPDNRAMDINPDDIASITVLKGPAATALYGISAQSGAIIITTKKGGGSNQPGPVVSFSHSTTFDQVNKLPKLQQVYGQGSDGVYSGPTSGEAGRRVTWGPAISNLYWDNIPTDVDQHGTIVEAGDPAAKTPVTPYDPTDFFQTGTTVNNTFSVGGGNEKSGYRMSIGNLHQKGTTPKSKYDKTNFSISGQSALSNRFSASASVNYIKSASDRVQQGSNTSGVMLGLLRTPPTFDNSFGLGDDAADNPSSYILADGTQRNYRGGVGYDNPYWTVNRNPYHQNLDRFFGSTQIDYRLFDWMNITYRVGGDVYSQSTRNIYDINSSAFTEGAAFLVDYFNSQFNSDFIIRMTHRFNSDFNGELILGQNYFTNTSTTRLSAGSGFAIPGFLDITNSTSFNPVSESLGRKRTSAYYGQAQLDYKSQLYLTLTGREEETSTTIKNTFFYPSASLGWVFTEPLGLSDNKTFPYGKVRVSFAQVGKDAPIQALKTYYVPSTVSDGFTAGIFWPFDGNSGYSISNPTNTIGNPGLKPYNTKSYEGGFDLAFFQNRLGLNATYYYSKTSDEIFTVPIAYSTGFPAAILNAGDITNHGIELTLTTTPVSTKSGFKWDVTLNWSTNKNKVEKLYPGVDNLFISGFENGAIYAVEGQPFGQIYASRYVRVNPDDASSAYLINDDPTDDGYGMPIVGTTNDVVGDVNPDWMGSALSTFSFKGFSLGFQIEIKQGGDVWNGTRGALSYFGTSDETAARGATKVFDGNSGHVSADGSIVHFAPDGVTEVSGAGGTNATTATLNQYYWQNIGSSFIGPGEASVEDGSYVRFRQISLGYSFPKTILNKMKFQSLSVSVFATNPILWTDYTGVDPETSLGGPNNGQGLDYFNNPGIRSYGFRVSVGL